MEKLKYRYVNLNVHFNKKWYPTYLSIKFYLISHFYIKKLLKITWYLSSNIFDSSTSFIFPLKRGRMWALSSELKLSKLVLQIGCPFYHPNLWRNQLSSRSPQCKYPILSQHLTSQKSLNDLDFDPIQNSGWAFSRYPR